MSPSKHNRLIVGFSNKGESHHGQDSGLGGPLRHVGGGRDQAASADPLHQQQGGGHQKLQQAGGGQDLRCGQAAEENHQEEVHLPPRGSCPHQPSADRAYHLPLQEEQGAQEGRQPAV